MSPSRCYLEEFADLKANVKVEGFQCLGVVSSTPYTRYAARLSIFFGNTINQNTDRPTTEKLDYFLCTCNLVHVVLHNHSNLPFEAPIPLNIVFIVAYIGHVSYLTLLPRFDYACNIAFKLTLGLTNNLLWILYSSPQLLSFIHRFPSQPKSYQPKFATKAGIFVLGRRAWSEKDKRWYRLAGSPNATKVVERHEALGTVHDPPLKPRALQETRHTVRHLYLELLGCI